MLRGRLSRKTASPRIAGHSLPLPAPAEQDREHPSPSRGPPGCRLKPDAVKLSVIVTARAATPVGTPSLVRHRRPTRLGHGQASLTDNTVIRPHLQIELLLTR